jgi:hypothetical protein
MSQAQTSRANERSFSSLSFELNVQPSIAVVPLSWSDRRLRQLLGLGGSGGTPKLGSLIGVRTRVPCRFSLPTVAEGGASFDVPTRKMGERQEHDERRQAPILWRCHGINHREGNRIHCDDRGLQGGRTVRGRGDLR